MRFTVATYNIHKGFSHLTRRVVIHELRDKLHGLAADMLFLQEVQGVHRRHAGRYRDWPLKPQHEFIADKVWREVAYGRNAITRHGHHGNAVLSRFPIIAQANQDISAHVFESRGMLHCVMQLQRGLPPLHCINVHLGLFERGRRWQVRALCERIRESVPADAPLIIAGDFNDWRRKADRMLQERARRGRGVRGGARTAGAHISVGAARCSGSTASMRADCGSSPPMCTTPIRWRGCPTMPRSPRRSTLRVQRRVALIASPRRDESLPARQSHHPAAQR